MDPNNILKEISPTSDASNFLQGSNAAQSNQSLALGEGSLSQPTLLWSTYIIANALTLLGIGLSRRTKPWCFFLRICYRIGRTNLKWTAFWLVWMLLSQLSATGSDLIMTSLLKSLSSFSATTIGKHMQMSWAVMQGHPVVTGLSFLAYVILIAWAVRSLVPGTPRSAAAPRSRWTFLLECLLHPVSVNTINQANDFDLEPDGMELLIERLAMPNLWLTPMVPTDYLRYLPTWQFQGWFLTCAADRLVRGATTDSSVPSGMIPSSECAICLEKYKTEVVLCGLPCGHHFHEGCIMAWLQRDNHHCPICRWPAYRCK